MIFPPPKISGDYFEEMFYAHRMRQSALPADLDVSDSGVGGWSAMEVEGSSRVVDSINLSMGGGNTTFLKPLGEEISLSTKIDASLYLKKELARKLRNELGAVGLGNSFVSSVGDVRMAAASSGTGGDEHQNTKMHTNPNLNRGKTINTSADVVPISGALRTSYSPNSLQRNLATERNAPGEVRNAEVLRSVDAVLNDGARSAASGRGGTRGDAPGEVSLEFGAPAAFHQSVEFHEDSPRRSGPGLSMLIEDNLRAAQQKLDRPGQVDFLTGQDEQDRMRAVETQVERALALIEKSPGQRGDGKEDAGSSPKRGGSLFYPEDTSSKDTFSLGTSLAGGGINLVTDLDAAMRQVLEETSEKLSRENPWAVPNSGASVASMAGKSSVLKAAAIAAAAELRQRSRRSGELMSPTSSDAAHGGGEVTIPALDAPAPGLPSTMDKSPILMPSQTSLGEKIGETAFGTAESDEALTSFQPAELTALVGCGHPLALSPNFLAVGIGDWVSLESHTSEAGDAHQHFSGGSSSSSAGPPPPSGVLTIGSEVLALETHGNLLAVLCDRFVRLYDVAHRRAQLLAQHRLYGGGATKNCAHVLFVTAPVLSRSSDDHDPSGETGKKSSSDLLYLICVTGNADRNHPASIGASRISSLAGDLGLGAGRVDAFLVDVDAGDDILQAADGTQVLSLAASSTAELSVAPTAVLAAEHGEFVTVSPQRLCFWRVSPPEDVFENFENCSSLQFQQAEHPAWLSPTHYFTCACFVPSPPDTTVGGRHMSTSMVGCAGTSRLLVG